MAAQSSLVSVFGLIAILAVAPLSARAQDERKFIHESPYYLPGLSNTPFNFSGSSSEGTGAFRVLGASTKGLSLSFTHAEASCLALQGGRGLALDSMSEAQYGTRADLHWVGGWRTALTDENCAKSTNPSWPYFTVQDGGEATDFNGCGADPLHDWVWRKWLEADKMIEVPFNSNPGVKRWWEDSSVTGVGELSEPTGWDGPYNLAQGDRYQNCTATRVYDKRNKKVQAAAVGKAWLSDEVCTETLQRWVCELDSADSGVSALSAPGATGLGKVADSPFYITGVSDTAHPADDYKKTVYEGSVYRVLGIPPPADADFEFEGSSHVLTWQGAQQACLDMGGHALAAPAKPSVDKPAFSFLQEVAQVLKNAKAAASTPESPIAGGPVDQPAFWLSAAYLSPPEEGAQNSSESFGWTWFPSVEQDNTGKLLLSNTSAEWPMASNETRWDNGFPKHGVFTKESQLPLQSCIAAVWPQGDFGERWQNFACSTRSVRYFVRFCLPAAICRFPNAETGMPSKAVASEVDQNRGLLRHLPFNREILLIIAIACIVLCILMCCCAHCNPCGNSEGTVVVSSFDHIMAWHKSRALRSGITGTMSLDGFNGSRRDLLRGGDSLGKGKWKDLPNISENEEMAGDVRGRIRASGTLANQPQVLRENAGGPITADSIDAATRCMRASSYWSVGESVDTDFAGKSHHDTVVSIGSGHKGMRAMQAHFDRPGQLDIAHPTSEPSQGAVASPQCEPTVVSLPRSPAIGESPDSIGMRIPAAVRWSASPRSNQSSPTQPSASPARPSDDGKGSNRSSGSSLLERLRNAARRAGHERHNVKAHSMQHTHPSQLHTNQAHVQNSLSPRRYSNGTGQQAANPSSASPNTIQQGSQAQRSPSPIPALAAQNSQSYASPPSSQREYVGEEKFRTADGNVVTTHVFRRPSPQVSPESSFSEDPRGVNHQAMPPQLIIPSDLEQSADAAAYRYPSARSCNSASAQAREPSPRRAVGRRSQRGDEGVVYACQQYPPSPDGHNDLEMGPSEDSGGVIDILRGSYPPPPNLAAAVPSPTGSVPCHSSVHTSTSAQTLGSISVFAAEPSLVSLSQDPGPRHRMSPALPQYNSQTATSKPYFASSMKPPTAAAQNSLEFPQGEASTATMSVSTPWHCGAKSNATADGASVNTSSNLVPLSESGSSYRPTRSDSPPALGPKHSKGDVGVPTPAASRYAPKLQSSPEPHSTKPPLAYLSTATVGQSRSTPRGAYTAPKSPSSPVPRPGRPKTLDASIDYQPQSIWSHITPQDVSEGLEDAANIRPTGTTALQHFSGSTASGTSVPTTPRAHSGSRSHTHTAPSSPEITTAVVASPNATSSNVFSPTVPMPSPCAESNPAGSPSSQWTLESSDVGWQGNNKGNNTNSMDGSYPDSIAAAVAARTCMSPQSRQSSFAGPVPVSRARPSLQNPSATASSTQRASVTSLDSTAGQRGWLPTLPEHGVQGEGSAALVDAWLTSVKQSAKTAADGVTTSLDGLIVNSARGDFGTVLGQYQLLGPMERIIGGQGVIQFAKCKDPSMSGAPEPQVALKFYVQPSLIRVETAIYGSPTLAASGALPRSAELHLNTTKELRTATGAALPPCLVMERGMSLKEWMMNSRMNSQALPSDCKTAIKALLQLSQCLVSLHSSGFVHRDVKPGAVLWLPSEYRWALVNFCRAARIGSTSPAPCSLAYAAPEVAASARCSSDGGVQSDSEPVASPAADAWSLGIVALELFSRSRALDVHQAGAANVLMQLQGDAPLPWERENGLRCLGPLAGCVAKLLNRDPAQRPSVADFVRDATAELERVSA